MAPITNLYTRYTYPLNQINLPVVVLMHSFLGSAADAGLTAAMTRIANCGLFVMAIGMRARDGAGGSRDASGREVYDIYDGVERARVLYPTITHPDKAAIVGYSGGGGSALAAACKFPDFWNVVVSHFGVSDYGRDATDGWHNNNDGTYTADIETMIGGDPSTVPNNYYARDATAAIQNYSGGYLYMYHDKADTSVPWVHSDRIKFAMDGAGLTNYSASFTNAGDGIRWEHGYPDAVPALITAEPTWTAKILSQPAWIVPVSGTLTVIGYIKTRRFTIWLNVNGTAITGIDAVATVAYNTTTDRYTVTPLTGSIDCTITQGAKTGSEVNFAVPTEIVVS